MLRALSLLVPLLVSPAGPALAADTYPMRAELVADGVYAVITPTRDLPNPDNRGWNSNSAFVLTGHGVLLFDSGSSTAIGESLRRVIAGVTGQPVRWIVNSHAHGDHWLGNAAFEDSVEAVYASSRVDRLIRTEGRNWIENFDRMTAGATGASRVLPPSDTVDTPTELLLGGVPVHLFPSGNSHSPGDLLAWLPEQRVLFSGDVVYSDRMPSTNAGDIEQWIGFLDELVQLQPVAVVPGHGALTDVRGVQRLQALLRDLWQAVVDGYDAGLSDYEMVPGVIDALAAYRPFYPGLEDKLPRDISKLFLQVEAGAFR